MKNRIISVVLVMILMLGTCNVATAADAKGKATRDSLKSYGSIEYHNGNDKVVFNSEDLYMLADQIDQVKLDVADQLEAMNTYFTAGNGISLNTNKDINVTHAQPSSEYFVDPATVTFDTLLEGIAASQSISTDVSDYGYPAGTKLYSIDGKLTTDGSDKDATEITVSSAAADNLAAGAAAWVNGKLIIGNGADNNDYYQKGVLDGRADVIANPKEYGVSIAILKYLVSNGNTKTYTCPVDGIYKFLVTVTYDNKENHYAIDNKVTLKIGSETITVFNYYWDGSRWQHTGSTNSTITRECTAGTQITLTTAAKSDYTGAYTNATLVIY